MHSTELTYRKTAAATGGSGLGLLIALYDTLAGDLRRAADAQLSNDIEKRCREVNHALLVIAHLQEWVARGTGGVLADNLLAFYTSLRRKVMEAQVKRSAEILEDQMIEVLKIREAFQALDGAGGRGAAPGPEILSPDRRPKYPGIEPAESDRESLSWTA
jgi:flagellar secretion chaperone FliS